MLPEKVKIGWREYKIEEGEARFCDDGQLNGEIYYTNDKIYIYNKLTDEQKRITLLHEILHGIFYISGHIEWRKNEELIDCITENLYQVFKDNPELLR